MRVEIRVEALIVLLDCVEDSVESVNTSVVDSVGSGVVLTVLGASVCLVLSETVDSDGVVV